MKRRTLILCGLLAFPGLPLVVELLGWRWGGYDIRYWAMLAAGACAWLWVIREWPPKR